MSFVLLVALCLAGAVWYSREVKKPPAPRAEVKVDPDGWIERLYSQNPREAAEAARQLSERGADALPAIRAALQDPAADRPRRKAALKACSLLGSVAAPAIEEVAVELEDPDLAAEAGLALSFMGPAAFTPLREALASDDPVVRRESLRSIGKLKERAPLESGDVVPLLLGRIADPDPGVRVVAMTYLGIIHEGGPIVVGSLVDGLSDSEADVRRAAASALGSFGPAAAKAVPALKKAATDTDEDVAREAGLALVKLQSKK